MLYFADRPVYRLIPTIDLPTDAFLSPGQHGLRAADASVPARGVP
jgi:hypothetical protein